MIELSKTVPIIYHGGTYGTYLHWCLDTLCSNDPVKAPFTNVGNSHMFSEQMFSGIECWQQYKDKGSWSKIVRLHPKTKQNENLTANLNEIMSTVDRAIYIYPDSNSVLLTINNYYSKIWKNWWQHQFDSEINPEKIYNNWPVSRVVPIDQIPAWIKREFLSMYLVPAWYAQVEWNHLDLWKHPNCCNIFVDDLLNNFESTIETVGKFCHFDFCRSIKDLEPFHKQNIKLQKFIGQDQICNNIIDAVLSEQDYSWTELPLPSEAWVQWQLRNLGWEIRCHGLDMFPTNSVHLKELLYSV